jgi:L-cysteine desulfidase
VIKAKSVTAAACDARMAGLDFPAMSCTTSGNVGIGASLPLVVVAEELERSEEELLRAIALSFLLTIYTKSHIGRLSAICACIIAASLGTTAGTVLLLGGKLAEIEKAINNVVGAIGGVICDGAKFGCSLKLASGVGVALESAFLAMKGVSIPPRDGVVCDCADETIHAIGRIAKEGMATTPEVLLDILMKRQKITSR